MGGARIGERSCDIELWTRHHYLAPAPAVATPAASKQKPCTGNSSADRLPNQAPSATSALPTKSGPSHQFGGEPALSKWLLSVCVSLVFKYAEALNIGWGVIAGTGVESLRDKLNDRTFRNKVADRLLDDDAAVSTSAVRRVLKSSEFREWMSTPGAGLEKHLSDDHLRALGVHDDDTARSTGEAIGAAIAGVAFAEADWTDREILRRLAALDEIGLYTITFLQDIWELLVRRGGHTEPDFPFVFQPPAVTNHYIERHEQFDTLDDAVRSAATTVVGQVVSGLGGIGKTQLVAHFATARQGEFDLVAWFDASIDLTAQLAGLGTRLGYKGAAAERAEATQQWLASTSRRCLVVLDNVEATDVLASFRASQMVSAIATTRLSHAVTSGFGPVLTLGVFKRDESLDYLRNRLGGDHAGADDLAAALGDLPLALAHAAAYCALNNTSLSEYCASLTLPAGELFRDNLDEFYQLVIHETWTATMARLAPLSTEVIRVASYLHPGGIPLEAFDALITVTAADLGQRQLKEAAGELVRWSLADWTNDGLLETHRLLQKVVRDDPSNSAHHVALSYVTAATDFDPGTPAAWPIASSVSPHAQALLATLPGGDAAIAGAAYKAANRCLLAAAHAALHRAAIDLGESLTGYAEGRLGAEHPQTLDVWANLAASYSQGGSDRRGDHHRKAGHRTERGDPRRGASGHAHRMGKPRRQLSAGGSDRRGDQHLRAGHRTARGDPRRASTRTRSPHGQTSPPAIGRRVGPSRRSPSKSGSPNRSRRPSARSIRTRSPHGQTSPPAIGGRVGPPRRSTSSSGSPNSARRPSAWSIRTRSTHGETSPPAIGGRVGPSRRSPSKSG